MLLVDAYNAGKAALSLFIDRTTYAMAPRAAVTAEPIYDFAGAQVSMPLAVSRHYRLTPVNWVGTERIQLVSNSAEGADRAFVLNNPPCMSEEYEAGSPLLMDLSSNDELIGFLLLMETGNRLLKETKERILL